ncbi:MAG: hypothetical protein AB7J35_03880 [Dehalococcoidia bacterium]
MYFNSKLIAVAAAATTMASLFNVGTAFAADAPPAADSPAVSVSSLGALNLGGYGVVDPTGEALAEFLGLDVDTLSSELASGSTLAQIAEAQGIPTQDLRDFLHAEVFGVVLGDLYDGTLSDIDAWMLLSRQFAALDSIVGTVTDVFLVTPPVTPAATT